jgi:hypothetical protein
MFVRRESSTTASRVPRPIRIALFVFGISCYTSIAAAQQSANGNGLRPGHALPSPTATAVRAAGPIVIDGRFDEESWSSAPIISELIQRDPNEGAPATERTEIRILFDNRKLYFAVYCFDSNPSGIVATELRRDDDLETDDSFEIMIDTFHDHRNGYRFRVNALGTMRDEAVTGEGQARNENWDENWETSGRITEDGWLAEIAIPFKAMRFASTNGTPTEWGINFHRTVMRKNEELFWSGFRRGYTFTRISGAGHLVGLSDMEGFQYRVKSYVNGGAFQTPADTSYKGKVGIDDIKYMLTPDLALDVTINPDFAQADVDQAQVNLSRFSLFFPEKREFFQEGAGTFSFGGGGFGNDLVLFHSRRIGLSDDRLEIPIMGGVKITGKQGPLEVGVLNMQTRPAYNLAGQNFSAARLKANILGRSFVGGMLTRNTGSPLGGDNIAAGFDSYFNFYRYLTINASLAKTDSTGLDEKDWSYRGRVAWASDRFDINLARLRIEENFRPEMGFVGRAEPGWTGVERTQGSFGYNPRPGGTLIRQFGMSTSFDYITNQEGYLDTRDLGVGFSTTFQAGDIVSVDLSRNFERLVEPFRIRGGGGTVPIGDYRFNQFSTSYTGHRGRRISGGVTFSRGGFFDGTITTVSLEPSFRPNANLSVIPSFEWNRIERHGSAFITREVNTEINYALNHQWLTRTAVTMNSQDRQVLLNARLNYIFRPGDDLFVVYSEDRRYGDLGGLVNRAFIVKITYSIDR